jgi:hypothetical protein
MPTLSWVNPAGSNPVPLNGASNANWTLLYANGDSIRAGKRYHSTPTNEIRVPANAAFAAAGRVNPTRELGI